MSSKTSRSTVRDPVRIGSALSTELRRRAMESVRAAAFWAAIVLPVAYLPAAYDAMGFETAWSTVALFAVHVACVVIGHEHDTPSTGRS